MSLPVQRVSNSQPVLVNILLYVGLEDARAGAVNKAFSRALEVLKGRVCTQLLMPLNMHKNAGPDDDAPERLGTKYDETIRAHEEWLGNPIRRWAFGSDEATSLFTAIEQLKDGILEQQNSPYKNMRSASLHDELARWGEKRQKAVDWTTGKNEMEAAFDEDSPFPPLYRSLQGIVVQENLVQRFFTATSSLNPADPSFHSDRLAVLHASQRIAARANPESERRFTALPEHSCSLERFLRAEETILNGEIWGGTLLEIGQAITRVVSAQPNGREILFPHTAAAWRLWFRDRQNIRHINALTSLDLRSNVLPEELWECRNLRSLTISGRRFFEAGPMEQDDPVDLPPQMANLTNLTELSISRFRFQRVPDVIGRLQNLQSLSITEAEIEELPPFLAELPHLSYLDVRSNPIRVLPDSIFQRIDSNQRLSQPGGVFIDQLHLTHVPFALKFKERFSLALPTLDWGGVQYVVYALLGIPLFLYNHVGINVSIAILTLIRDLLGYDRLVPADE